MVPLFTDQEGFLARTPQMLGRSRAMRQMEDAAPGRVAIYGVENREGTPVYVHAKVCVMDDTWSTIGSDNFNRRSWTHDSELSAVVVDPSADDHSPFARRLRLTLAAEHLDRPFDPSVDPSDDASLLEVMADCARRGRLLRGVRRSRRRRLDEWYAGGQVGERPPGRLRRLPAARAEPLGANPRDRPLPRCCTTPTAARSRCASRAASDGRRGARLPAGHHRDLDGHARDGQGGHLSRDAARREGAVPASAKRFATCSWPPAVK